TLLLPIYLLLCCVFFSSRRRHTRFSRDWSSDVCSSDLANILETGEFVVNLVSEDLAEAMNITCMDAPPEVDELACAGLHAAASVKVAPPRIAESPVSFECRTFQTVETGPHQVIVLGRVVMAHLRDEMVLDAERCHV